MNTATVLLIMLGVVIVAMALLAIFYLRRRCLSLLGYIFWGLLSLLVPVLGPFLVIASRPGTPRVVKIGNITKTQRAQRIINH